MADPYKVFTFDMPDGNGGRQTYRKSTAELLKIDRATFDAGRNELSSILSELQQANIILVIVIQIRTDTSSMAWLLTIAIQRWMVV